MNTLLKRIISLVLCLVMVVGYVPVNAFADETGEAVSTEATEAPLVVADEESEPDTPDKPADPKGPGKEEKPGKPEKEEKPGKPEKEEKPGKPEHEKPGKPEAPKPEQETTPVTEETVPETTEATVPVTEETVPETTEETVPEETEPVMMMMAAPRAAAYQVPSPYAEQGYVAVDAAVIFTDLHTSKNDYKDTEIGYVMGAVASTGLDVSSVTSGGDAFSVNKDSDGSNGKYTGLTSTITASIRNYLGNDSVPVNYVWSDHDRYAVQADGTTLLDKTSRVVFSNNNYYVYALSMGDLCSYDRYVANFNYTATNNTARVNAGFTPTVDDAIAKFKADVEKMDKTRPLLIVSHQPLFDNRNDNAHAKAWFDAINKVAEEMDVFFFFGHNHKYDSSSDYYYGKNSTMPVALPKSTSGTNWNYQYDTGAGYQGYLPDINLASSNETLNFTHLCAGYMDPHTTGSYDSNTTRQNTAMMVVLLRNDAGEEIVNLVTVGAGNEYNANKYPQNHFIASEFDIPADQGGNEGGNQGGNEGSGETPEETEPTQPETPAAGELSQGGVTVKVSGLTGLTVATVEKPAALEGIFGADAVAYDISVEGFDNYSGIASVTVPVTGENAENFAVFHVDGDKLTQMPGALSADGKSYTFTTAHFSVFVGGSIVAGAQLSGTDKEGHGETSGAASYQLAQSITSGKKYLIASGGSGNVYFMKNDGTRSSRTSVNNIAGLTNVSDYLFTFTASGDKYTILDDDNQYVYPNASYKASGKNKGWSYSLVHNGTSNEAVTVTPQSTAGAYHIYRTVTSNKKTDDTYLYHYNTTGYSGFGATSDESNVYLFEQILAPGATVTFKLQKPADMVLGGAETQDLTYEITMGDTAVTNATITWSSSDNTVVTVNNGKLTVNDDNKEGTATITATLTQVNGSKLSSNIVLTTTVSVIKERATDISVPEVIEVFQGTRLTKQDRGDITVTYEDESKETVDLTLDMLEGDFNVNAPGSYQVAVTYAGITKELTLIVKARQSGIATDNSNPYPEYPHEGAVKVSKTGTGINFQSTGIAQIEVAASGVPIKKGADVIVMLDTSSSMTSNTIKYSDGTSESRSKVLEDALKDLIEYFKTPVEGGEMMDLRVAIADFNGYYGNGVTEQGAQSGTPYDRTAGDYVRTNSNGTGNGYNQHSEAKVYTGSKALNAGAFVAAKDLAATYTLNYTSGTNYDYAFDAIYQLGTAIKSADRDLFVIFMSDGASLQWNYFGTENGYTKWNNWLAGTWNADNLTTTNLNSTDHSYFYDLDDHDGDGHINEHRMANAIKGNPEDEFEIIRKSTAGLPNGTLTPAGKDYLYKVNGLGATMFTINFDAKKDGQITVDNIDKALASTASDQTGSTKYYYKIQKAEDLGHAFNSIGAEIAYAASNARFVDQMGANYSLKLGALKDLNGAALDVDNKIEILSYDIYTSSDTIPDGKNIGDRKGTFKVLETITFNEAGTEAYSSLDSTGPNGTIPAKQNILHNGVIYANTFWYNNNPQGVAIAGVSYPTGKDTNNLTTNPTNVLPAETFYWKLGTVQTSELAMRYYVYLEGSMEGTRPSGSYPTNKFATLYYDNYVGQPCYKDTISPMLAWKSANVSYAFYLVNASGEVVVNQTTGATGTFANKIALTTPVVFDENLFLNEDDAVVVLEKVIASSVLPEYYSPYDMGASYRVQAKSDGSGHWSIETSYPSGPRTTYVTGFDPAAPDAYTTDLAKETTTGVDYTHTTVWFAVQLVTEAHPDTVVVDYGLPVDISVLTNDMFGDYGKLAAVGKEVPMVEVTNENGTMTTKEVTAGTTLATGFGSSYNGKYGTATVNTTSGKVRYTLNSMKMDSYDKFAYAVYYDHKSNDTNDGYYYDTVTVIPATTIYYEDNFLNFKDMDWQSIEGGQAWEGEWVISQKPSDESVWSRVGTTDDNAVQGEDRPGQYSLADANNIYGYDGVNLGMSTYSLGSAMMARVDYDHGGQASFDFCGTGFDVIGLTNTTTGTIIVKVYDSNGNLIKNHAVDTYYGYKQANCHVVYTCRNVGTKDNAQYEWVMSDVLHDGECTDDCKQKYTLVTSLEPASADLAEKVETIDGVTKVTRQAEKRHMRADAWIVDTSAEDTIWQVPVMQIENLAYGNYKGVIEVIYEPGFDHVNGSVNGTYDFYMDAIRIYDPANDGAQDNDRVIEDAYIQDGEGWPSYVELRNGLINEGSLGNDDTTIEVEGLVFIDGDASVGDAQISDYISYGPNNEVYLAPGQRVAFQLRLPQNIAKVNIGIKSADGKKGTYTITNISGTTNEETRVTTGKYFHEKTSSIDTATDMYYDLTDWKDNIIVISNTGNIYNTDGIISLTNIKFTYTSDPSTNEAGIFITPKMTKMLLRALNAPAVEEVPEETKPDPEVIKNELKAAVNAAKDLKEKDYTKDSYKAVKSALKAAEKVLKDKKASQAKIEAALEALNDAIAALEAKPDNSELKEAVKDAKKLKEKDYTKDSYKAVKSALKAAEKVLNDKKASQAEIDEALANLNAAVDGLKTVDVKPIPPKPGASGDNVKNGFKVLESIMNVFINLLKGNNR